MAKGRQRRYFDSDTIIRLVQNDPDAAPVIEALLEESSSGRWTVVVSAMSILEVTRPRSKAPDLSQFAVILSFFENGYIHIREIDLLLADKARRLLYDYLWLRPQDAVHLAAAIDTGCEVFYTFDNQLIERFNGERGLRVQEPELPKKPEVGDLPLFRRQGQE